MPCSLKRLENGPEPNSSFRKLDISVLGLGVGGGNQSSMSDPWLPVPAMRAGNLSQLNWEGRLLRDQMICFLFSPPKKAKQQQGGRIGIEGDNAVRNRNGSCEPKFLLPKGYARGERRRSRGHKWRCRASIPPTKNPKRTGERILNKARFCCLFPPLFLQPLGSPGATFF